MEILYLLIPLSVVLVFLIGVALWWFVRSGQFDDLEGPAYRVLMDDDRPRQEPDQELSKKLSKEPGKEPNQERRPESPEKQTGDSPGSDARRD